MSKKLSFITLCSDGPVTFWEAIFGIVICSIATIMLVIWFINCK